jgi:hypothetical protein
MSSFDVEAPQWVCFISGLEVPIITAATTAVSNQLATAQVTMPYSPFLSKLPKHTKITLFSFTIKSPEPKLEFDGIIQSISWRKDKLGGNTGLFIMAQTDGVIWSARKKHNFYIDNGFGIDRMLSMSQDLESHGVTAQNAIFDSISRTISTADGDGGKATTIFLTHKFNTVSAEEKKFNGTMNYVDCGAVFKTSDNKQGTQTEDKNPNYYARYIQKYYEDYKVVNKVCRLPLPPKFLKAFEYAQTFGIIMNTLGSLQGEVNFWNFSTYICDQFAFEVYDIPDATSLTLDSATLSYINSKYVEGQNLKSSIIAEYLVKPKSPFGPIPLSNIIFPDQVLDKSFFRNFQAEVTRVSFAQMMMRPGSANIAELAYFYYQGPHFKVNDNADYFSSYDVHFNPQSPNPNSFLSRSQYEDEFGVNNKMIELSELSTRLFSSKQNFQPIQNMVNHQFLEAYTDKVSFTMQVSPNVEVVPGLSILVLDENGEHLLAYCYGREKIWDKNGQSIVNLKLLYPRAYDIKTKAINDLADPFDPEEYPDTYAKDIKILSSYIGVDFIDPTKNIIDETHKFMAMWYKFNQNTSEVKDQLKAWRTYTSYSVYGKFFEVEQKYDVNNKFNKMDEKLIRDWDISLIANGLAALQYTYAENGYKNPQITNHVNTLSDGTAYGPYFKPLYNDLNTPGPIQVSTYISGIVNCHNRYLMQIGNSIT